MGMRSRAMASPHQGSGPSSFENVPVGPVASMSARRTGSRAACWTVRVPWKLLRSVAVKPGHAALTLLTVDPPAGGVQHSRLGFWRPFTDPACE
jgi:hypothetical protein